MKKFVEVMGAAVASAALVTVPSGGASAAVSGATTAVTQAAAGTTSLQTATWSLNDQFARERVARGASDSSVYHIAHVTELQYRLTWTGLYSAGVTGYFGSMTEIAVKHYQRREGLPVSGVATRATWAHLIHDTIKRSAVPAICKGAGWHACYDRSAHQVTLWKAGQPWNSWLVRGGAVGYETRLGNYTVYSRDIDHKSGLYDGSPMPYSQFFAGGQALHGSGFMMDPFDGHSHGCVNFYIEDARQLWNLTSTKPLRVSVYGAWD